MAASIERVFDAARDMDLHVKSMSRFGEAALAGRTTGLIECGDEVTFRARHFGLPLRLTSRVTQLDRPNRFRDSVVRGPFRRFDHEHRFEEMGDDRTLMIDEVEYVLPAGPAGKLADRLFVGRRLRRVLSARHEAIKAAAERD